jgi:hypothetical protein
MRQDFYFPLILLFFLFSGCNQGQEFYSRPAPEIIFDNEEGVYHMKAGNTLTLAPQVLYAQDAVFEWIVNDRRTGTEQVYLFTTDSSGTYYLTFKVIREDITVSKNIRIDVERKAVPAIYMVIPEGGFSIVTDSILTLHPIVENGHNATFTWKVNEEEAGRDSIYLFSSSQTGVFQLDFCVENTDGSDVVSFPVIVNTPEGGHNETQKPIIFLDVPEGGFSIVADSMLTLHPIVENGHNATFIWKVNEEEVSHDSIYVFSSSQTGVFQLNFHAENTAGCDQISFPIRVSEPDSGHNQNYKPEIFLDVPEGGFSIVADSILTLCPIVEYSHNAIYIWKVNEVEVSRDSIFLFRSSESGVFQLLFSAENTAGLDQISFPVTVNVNPDIPSNKYFRPLQDNSRTDWNVIYDYIPAPGQFINETNLGGFTGEDTREEAIAYAQNRLHNNLFVSLGAFGGYVVAGFDHSIVNDGGYNLQIEGNAHDNSSEPGIVWVMQDSNGNGLPDDGWFELKGSEDTGGTVTRNYSVTYFKPRQPGSPVHWIDNTGVTGTVDYLAAFHDQETYYPLWTDNAYYTLTGTCLESPNYLSETGSWISPPYDWGYADNDQQGLFRISDAITPEGDPVDLEFIDFVKIQTGVNGKSGWLGELSTEITGIRDYNLVKR